MTGLEIYKDRNNFLLLDHEQIEKLKVNLKSWNCIENKFLSKRYNFDSYLAAKKFVDIVAYFAEDVNHHPELLFGYKFVEASIWTHNVNGLTKADFAYTENLDNLYENCLSSSC